MSSERPKPCPFCGNAQIYLGQESAMSYYAKCYRCGARSKSVEVPSRWPEKEIGPIPEDIGERGDYKDGTYWGNLENYLMGIAAKAWNNRIT